MINKIISFCNSVINGAIRRFKSEELFFGLSAIGTIIVDYGSVVPALFVTGLLAFYYLFFGWYLFSIPKERHILFSIISGVVYSICLTSMAITILLGESYYGTLFLVQIVLFVPLGWFLFKKDWGVYKGNHYIRMMLIMFLNFYILFFR